MCQTRGRIDRRQSAETVRVPGRRIPGHWPSPGPEALAVAEPVTSLDLVEVSLSLEYYSPDERVC